MELNSEGKPAIGFPFFMYFREVRLISVNSKVTKFSLLIFLFILQLSLAAQTRKKVVGYLPFYKSNAIGSIDFCKLTHLNLCFANPDANGKLQMADVSNIVVSAKQQNPTLMVSVSLGGGVLPANTKAIWSNLIDYPQNRSALISNILGFVQINHFDGVDFDLEWDAVTAGYSDFAVQLNDSLKKHGKLFTAALPGAFRYALIADKALKAFDFINLMAYDKTGPWTPDNPGQHSSYEYAVQSVNFWKQQGISAEKLVLGVPFYGYNFNDTGNIFSFSYAEIINANSMYADLDNVGEAYYNGRTTIKQKVDLASEQAGGIMIWELSQDSFDSYSLLSTIHNEFTVLGNITSGLCGNILLAEELMNGKLKIYPVPARNNLIIELELNHKPEVSFFNIFGQKLNFKSENKFNKIVFDLTDQENGIYILKVESPDLNVAKRIVIQH